MEIYSYYIIVGFSFASIIMIALASQTVRRYRQQQRKLATLQEEHADEA